MANHSKHKPGLKLAAQVSAEPSDEDLAFTRQMGIEYVVLWTDGDHASYEYYASRKELFRQAGLSVYGFGNSEVHNNPAIVLNLPGRDEKIEEYKSHLWNLGRAGIPYTTYAHMADGIWSSEMEPTRGGAPARAFDIHGSPRGYWRGDEYTGPVSHDRNYSADEIWANFEYFIHQVAPVAEDAGVKIGIHPDDPPVAELGGVPRCIFSSFEGYCRALEIADSPNVGVCLCVGCWLEGGDNMGRDVVEAIRYFGQRRQLFKIHFRNVNRPLPHFVETYLDDGYMDMYKVMRALREAEFDGVIIADHIPLMASSPRVGTAFSIGYIKALIERADAEFEGYMQALTGP